MKLVGQKKNAKMPSFVWTLVKKLILESVGVNYVTKMFVIVEISQISTVTWKISMYKPTMRGSKKRDGVSLRAFYWVILSHSLDLYERATRRNFEVTKDSKLKNWLIDHRFFYRRFLIRSIFLNLISINFDQKILKNRQQ